MSHAGAAHQSSPVKVIGFDSWTKGIHHFERLAETFRARGIDLTVVHLGSWGTETGRPVEERIGSLRVRDVSYYGGRLREVLDRENPRAVLFLSTEAFAHRAFNRYCRQRDIPTVHVFHGLQTTVSSGDVLKIRVDKRLWLLRSHVPKQLVHYLPVYARSLWDTDATRSEWSRFATDVLDRFRGRYLPTVADDSRADKACVYIAAEIERAVERYGYQPEAVQAVGNPDLLAFDVAAHVVGSRLHDHDGHSQVMYIASGLIDGGYVYESYDQFLGHLIHTHRELSAQGKQMIVKPHPIHFGTPVLTALADAGVPICSNDEFIPRLRDCCASIVEPSSAALIPALMGMPVFLDHYGGCRPEHFGELFRSYPRAIPLSDVREFTPLLATNGNGWRADATRDWIGRACGPMPAQDMPNRVADVMLSAIAGKE